MWEIMSAISLRDKFMSGIFENDESCRWDIGHYVFKRKCGVH
jgi:hypothetical protein